MNTGGINIMCVTKIDEDTLELNGKIWTLGSMGDSNYTWFSDEKHTIEEQEFLFNWLLENDAEFKRLYDEGQKPQ